MQEWGSEQYKGEPVTITKERRLPEILTTSFCSYKLLSCTTNCDNRCGCDRNQLTRTLALKVVFQSKVYSNQPDDSDDEEEETVEARFLYGSIVTELTQTVSEVVQSRDYLRMMYVEKAP